jgi:hypothetical protein
MADLLAFAFGLGAGLSMGVAGALFFMYDAGVIGPTDPRIVRG